MSKKEKKKLYLDWKNTDIIGIPEDKRELLKQILKNTEDFWVLDEETGEYVEGELVIIDSDGEAD
ncbi:MAG: hypothetical protein QXO33_05790 [Nitrososphaeria archaeon]